jgi:hypothetical protein
VFWVVRESQVRVQVAVSSSNVETIFRLLFSVLAMRPMERCCAELPVLFAAEWLTCDNSIQAEGNCPQVAAKRSASEVKFWSANRGEARLARTMPGSNPALSTNFASGEVPKQSRNPPTTPAYPRMSKKPTGSHWSVEEAFILLPRCQGILRIAEINLDVGR